MDRALALAQMSIIHYQLGVHYQDRALAQYLHRMKPVIQVMYSIGYQSSSGDWKYILIALSLQGKNTLFVCAS